MRFFIMDKKNFVNHIETIYAVLLENKKSLTGDLQTIDASEIFKAYSTTKEFDKIDGFLMTTTEKLLSNLVNKSEFPGIVISFKNNNIFNNIYLTKIISDKSSSLPSIKGYLLMLNYLRLLVIDLLTLSSK